MLKWMLSKRRFYFLGNLLTMLLSLATILMLCFNINTIGLENYARIILIILNSMTLGGKALLVSSKLIYEYRVFKEKDQQLNKSVEIFKDILNDEFRY